jgi:hypothetical protein
MAERKRRPLEKQPTGKDDASGGGGYNGGGDSGSDDGRGPFGESEGAVRVHQAYIEHHLEGGEPATSQAYLRAFEQFQKLPGALRSKPPIRSPQPPKDDPGDDGTTGHKGKGQ